MQIISSKPRRLDIGRYCLYADNIAHIIKTSYAEFFVADIFSMYM